MFYVYCGSEASCSALVLSLAHTKAYTVNTQVPKYQDPEKCVACSLHSAGVGSHRQAVQEVRARVQRQRYQEHRDYKHVDHNDELPGMDCTELETGNERHTTRARANLLPAAYSTQPMLGRTKISTCVLAYGVSMLRCSHIAVIKPACSKPGSGIRLGLKDLSRVLLQVEKHP